MKHVVGVSLGSTKRDHKAQITLLGEEIIVERRGTNGDIEKAVELIRSLDGKVDAIGLGGTDRWFFLGNKRYTLREADRMAKAAQKTPVADGSMLKGVIERRAVQYIRDEEKIPLDGKNAFIVCALDRYGMASTLVESGCNLRIGDLAFALGISVFPSSLSTLRVLAALLMPIISHMPISMLYPTGKSQEQIVPKFTSVYEWADIIGGDCHFIKKHMPDDLSGKVIITNTVTTEDVEAFRSRGVKTLVVSTPEFNGRSFATNVIDAVLVALTGRRPEDFTPSDYLDILTRLEFRPRVEVFQ
ncbi:MAG: quinate 5-dehydrogenase [Firmicutes bacterium]|nr:quinate 5-dehydrogenase [Bacillota bacterium]HXL03548.1 quinate 5-dehydrogenase [Bacillota bacterium]